MIELTVALPIWNSPKIAWIAFEGLCQQKDIDFAWELIVMEEQINQFGSEKAYEYADRLSKVGCKKFVYHALDYQIPLPQKWKAMAAMMSDTSKGFLLQAADCFSEPLRLNRTLSALNEGYEWIHNRRGYYYNIQKDRVIEFDQKTFGDGCRTGLNMAIAAKNLKNLPDSYLSFGIDNWLYKATAPKKVLWIEGEMLGGVDTDGLNNISKKRKLHFQHPKPPFKSSNKKIEDIIPLEIATKLKSL